MVTRITQGTAYYLENGEEKWVHRKGIGWHDSYESAVHYVSTLAKRRLRGMNKTKKFVQADPATGYRFTSYRLEGSGEHPLITREYCYHRIDLSDLDEPYLSAVKKSLTHAELKKTKIKELKA
jgi:hypothetical protein